MQRSFVYACAGGLLSVGAPLGLLAVRGQCRDHGMHSTSWRSATRDVACRPRDYAYVTLSTALVFTVFGYVLGRQADRLAELSATDPLTGLSNARGLFDRLAIELARARRYREPLAVLLADLDGLKHINDRFGHHAGDAALRRLADVIRSQLRETDVAARWGGDEFVVMAPNTAKDAAVAMAERIRVLIPGEDTAWRLSGSLGVVVLDPQAGEEIADPATLMRAADAALYEAKRMGRDRVALAPTTVSTAS